MKTSVISQPFLALLAAVPAYVTAGPISGDPANYSKLSKRGLEDNCRNVPHFYDDSGFPACWDGFRDKTLYKVSPGTAEDCIKLADLIEENNVDNWELGGFSRENEKIAWLGTCNFNIKRTDDWWIRIGGTDVVDVLRDSVRNWCPDSVEDRDGKLVLVDDPVHKKCVMLGHGQMNECRRWGNPGRSGVSFAIGQAANSQFSFDNDGKIIGTTWTKYPDCVRNP